MPSTSSSDCESASATAPTSVIVLRELMPVLHPEAGIRRQHDFALLPRSAIPPLAVVGRAYPSHQPRVRVIPLGGVPHPHPVCLQLIGRTCELPSQDLLDVG